MTRYTLLIALLLSLASCDKQDIENTYNNQERSIDSYINNLSSSYRIARNGGSNRVVITEGVGSASDTLAIGDSIYFYFNGYTFNNRKGSLFATNYADVIRANNIAADSSAIAIIYGKDKLIKGLQNGLRGVKQGELCNIIFSAKYGYGNEYMFNVPKLTPLFFEIEVEKIVKN